MRLTLGLVVLAGSSCRPATFACSQDVQCEGGGGVCVDPGFCAFPDGQCDSGLAYAEFADSTLAGSCVEPGGAGSSGGSGPLSSSGSSGPVTTLGVDGSDDAPQTGGLSTDTSSTSEGAGTSTGGPGQATTRPTGSDAGGSSTGEPVRVQTVSYAASWAGCVFVDVVDPDPDGCTVLADGGMTVDTEAVAGMIGGAASLLIVPLGDEFAGADVVQIRLRIHVSDVVSADSDQSGEVWAVTSFTPDSLTSTLPMQEGGMPIADDLGPSLPNTDNVWVLPGGLVEPDKVLTLGLYALTTNGVDYDTHEAMAAPTVEIDYLP